MLTEAKAEQQTIVNCPGENDRYSFVPNSIPFSKSTPKCTAWGSPPLRLPGREFAGDASLEGGITQGTKLTTAGIACLC